MSRTRPLPGAHARDSDALVGDGVALGAAVVLALTLFRLCAVSAIDLVPDEAYYWLWSRTPSAGYFDHPPMIAWWIWCATSLFGATPLAVRLLPVFSGLLLSLAVFATMRELEFGRRIAAAAALWTNATFLIGGVVITATPDAPSVLFWALALWALARLRRTGKPALWLLVGVFAGLGAASKYSNLFLGLGIASWLLLDAKARRWITTPWPWLGGIVALALFLPVLAWNADHHWISFAKQFGRITDGHWTLRFAGEFLGAQFGLLNPLVAIFAAIAVVHLLKAERRGQAWQGGHILLVVSAPLLVYMAFHSLHDRVQGNWPAPIYPALAMLGAAAASRPSAPIHLRRLALWVLPVGIGLQVLGIGYLAVSGAEGLPFHTPVDQVAGWRELWLELSDTRRGNGAAWIATADYGLTGELAFHAEAPDRVQEVVERARYSFQPPDPALASQPALLVLRKRDRDVLAFGSCFAKIEPLGTIDRRAGARTVERYRIYLAEEPVPSILTAGCEATR